MFSCLQWSVQTKSQSESTTGENSERLGQIIGFTTYISGDFVCVQCTFLSHFYCCFSLRNSMLGLSLPRFPLKRDNDLRHQRPEGRYYSGKHSTTRGRYHGGRQPSRDDSFHSATVIPPLALDKPSIMKRYHRRQTTR